MNVFYNQTKIKLDQIYTGKMMYAFFKLIEEGKFAPGSNIVVLHTGGIQGISTIKDKLIFGHIKCCFNCNKTVLKDNLKIFLTSLRLTKGLFVNNLLQLSKRESDFKPKYPYEYLNKTNFFCFTGTYF